MTEVLVQGPIALRDWREAHRFPVPGREYMPRFKHGGWDGTWSPGKYCLPQRDGTWQWRGSRGFLPRLAVDLGIDVDPFRAPHHALWGPRIAAFTTAHPRWRELRDYQQQAVERLLLEGWGRLALATNAGKGATLALMASFAQQHGHRVLICCDEVSVYDALEGELDAWAGLTPARVQAGTPTPPTAPVTLAMVPTLHRRLQDEDRGKAWRRWLADMGMLLLDEADKATAATWREVCTAATGTLWRAGFSGTFPTPDGYDDLQLEQRMGPVLLRAQNMEMVDRGISARPLVTLYSFDVTTTLFPLLPKGAWRGLSGPEKRNWVYTRSIFGNTARHQFIASLIRPDTPTAVIVNRIAHGEELTAALPGAVFLDGSLSAAERIDALDAFRTGAVRVLVVTKILDRGTNRLGHAADLIFASGEGSTRQTLQRIGRGLRRAGGKEFLRLIDIIDRVREAEDDRRLTKAADYLHEAGRKRTALYASEQFDVKIEAAS